MLLSMFNPRKMAAAPGEDPEPSLTQTCTHRRVFEEGTRANSQAGKKAEADCFSGSKEKSNSRYLRAWPLLLQVVGSYPGNARLHWCREVDRAAGDTLTQGLKRQST